MIRRAVFWDFDGTAAHTAPDMIAALHKLQSARGDAPADYDAARARVSGGARALLQLAGIDESDPAYDAARAEFLARYEEGGYGRTVLFSGVKDALRELAADGWKWGIATNKPRRYFAQIAENLGIRVHPEAPPNSPPPASALVAGDDCARGKPSPEMLLLAAKIADAPPRRCIYIGDDRRDAEAARAAGMPFILAAWGYWPAADWKTAPAAAAIASSPRCIPPLARMLAKDFV
ncbi:MAG: HAD family hydrolase [Gammaproteobacteria bacterium]